MPELDQNLRFFGGSQTLLFSEFVGVWFCKTSHFSLLTITLKFSFSEYDDSCTMKSFNFGNVSSGVMMGLFQMDVLITSTNNCIHEKLGKYSRHSIRKINANIGSRRTPSGDAYFLRLCLFMAFSEWVETPRGMILYLQHSRHQRHVKSKAKLSHYRRPGSTLLDNPPLFFLCVFLRPTARQC